MNNSRIFTIRNAKFSGFYFYTNLNIWGDFKICISVPLIIINIVLVNLGNQSIYTEIIDQKFPDNKLHIIWTRNGSRTAATSKIELFVIIVNVHLGCCSSPSSASVNVLWTFNLGCLTTGVVTYTLRYFPRNIYTLRCFPRNPYTLRYFPPNIHT